MRPITILASVYRLWAKIMTMKALKHVQVALPDTLYGSVPGRSALDLALSVQQRLEDALLSGNSVQGISLDLSKAYNTLPRKVLGLISNRLGMGDLWFTYSAFLQKLRRHFVCGRTWGQEVMSQVGVPEGCPLSVLQMILITWLFTSHLRKKHDATLETYVDDWTVLGDDSEAMGGAMVSLDHPAKDCGLMVNFGKSYVFERNKQQVKHLQTFMEGIGLPVGVATNMRGLGFGIQTCSRASATLRNDRMEKAFKLLDRLQCMPWSFARKAASVKRGILPFALYGCEGFGLSKTYLMKLRAKCNRAVWGKQKYHLHYLVPLMSDSNFEPFLYAAKQRFRSLLRARSIGLSAQSLWNTSVRTKAYSSFSTTRGPVSLFQQQMRMIGWDFGLDGHCSVGDKTFCLWNLSVTQFVGLLLRAWEAYLVPQLGGKHALHDIKSFSLCRSKLPKNPDEMVEGFLSKVRLGGLFPNHRKASFLEEDSTCIFCGEEGTLQHRARSCPGTEHLRTGQTWDAAQALPDCALLGGLFPHQDAVDAFQETLAQDHHPDIDELRTVDDEIFFFTDGSATKADGPDTILATWAVTKTTKMSPQNTLCASGVVPGGFHSIFRAELHAANVAFRIAGQNRCTVFCDNKAVVAIVQCLLAEGYNPKRWCTHPHRDLIATTAGILSSGLGSYNIRWLKARRNKYDATDPEDLWRIHHNDRADLHAKAVFLHLPEVISCAHNLMLTHIKLQTQRKLSAALYLRSVFDQFP